MLQTIPQPQFNKIEAVFVDETNISVNNFQYFLKHFNIIYLRALDIENRMQLSDNLTDDTELHSQINYVLSNIDVLNKHEYRVYTSKLSTNENDLVICELDKHSPLKIIFGGSIIALTVALILAGGEVETDVANLTFKAEINKSLGESIQDLKKAFQ